MTFDPITFLEQAVSTPSHEDIGPMQDLLTTELTTHGFDPTIDDAGNTIATRGSGRPHIVLNTHIDTVGPYQPYQAVNGKIIGRGSCDAKGPLAALLDAFITAQSDARLTLAVTPDEETDSTGAAALDIDADAYIVGEPTGLDICNAARGRLEATVTVHGENAHAATPEAGENAIRGAAQLIHNLDRYDDEHGPGDHHPLGNPTLTPTVIRGGAATNQIPDSCTIVLDRRSVPPETAEEFIETLTAFITDHAPPPVTTTTDLAERQTPFLEAFETPPSDPFVTTFTEVSPGEIRPFTAATEASYFAPRAPTVVFGPGVIADEDGPVAHADREYVRTGEVQEAAEITSLVIDEYAERFDYS